MVKNNYCLIVDDHPAFARGLTSYLVELRPDLLILYARTAHEAVAMSKQIVFEYVFIDIHLGSVHASTILPEIKSFNEDAYCVAMSGDENPFNVDHVQRSGADAFLCKSETEPRILRKLEEVLNKSASKENIPSDFLQNSAEMFLQSLPSKMQKVAFLLLDGHPNKEIAEMKFVTEDTVKSHVKKIYEKAGVNGRAEFIARYANAAQNINAVRQ